MKGGDRVKLYVRKKNLTCPKCHFRSTSGGPHALCPPKHIARKKSRPGKRVRDEQKRQDLIKRGAPVSGTGVREGE